MGNHRFIQDIITEKIGKDITDQFIKDINFFSKPRIAGMGITEECIDQVQSVFNDTSLD